MKTREEIEHLKANWKEDPCWDIEDTEGFEEHREELIAFHDVMRHLWEARAEERRQEEHDRIDRLASRLKCSFELAHLIDTMQDTIDRLENRLTELQEQIDIPDWRERR